MTANSHSSELADQALNRDLGSVEERIRAVLDPEIPVITLDDLGVIRSITPDTESGGLRVTLTPTYSGCPAMHAMIAEVQAVGEQSGVPVEVITRLDPPWTTDWMSEQGREGLRRFGIAPPDQRDGAGNASASPGPVPVQLSVRQVACPQCGSTETEELSRFGSTACKSLRRCRSCAEPFELFKTI